MKKILCPVDFSDHSINVLFYASELARKLKSEILLFHSCHIPVVLPDTIPYQDKDLTEEREQDAHNKMEDVVSKLKKVYTEVDYDTVVRYGFAIDEIIRLMQDEDIGLIVMGTSGAQGFEELFLGTISASVAEKASCPVFIIPEGCKYSPFKQIVYATDIKGEECDAVEYLLDFASQYKAHVSFISISKDEQIDAPSIVKYALNELVNRTGYENISFNMNEGKDISEGLLDFAKSKKADLITLISRDKGFFKKMFTKSITKEMAYHSNIPLLVLHNDKS